MNRLERLQKTWEADPDMAWCAAELNFAITGDPKDDPQDTPKTIEELCAGVSLIFLVITTHIIVRLPDGWADLDVEVRVGLEIEKLPAVADLIGAPITEILELHALDVVRQYLAQAHAEGRLYTNPTGRWEFKP